MRLLQKIATIAAISGVTLSISTPVYAAPVDTAALIAEETKNNQVFEIPDDVITTKIDTKTFNVILSGINFAEMENSGHGFDVKKAIETALSEIGTTRPTGWNQPGECIMSAKRWLTAGGANWTGSGSPVSNYQNAKKVDMNDIMPGDVIQYQNVVAPSSWASGVHTVLIVGVNPDGTFKIVESNIPYGSGLVQMQENWTPKPPSGFEAVAWRF